MSNTKTDVQEAGDGRIYEVGYHIVPKVAEVDVPAEAEAIKKVLANHGASVIAEETPRMIQLSYEIARPTAGRRESFSKAYFGWVKFECEGTEAEAIGKEIAALPTTLRSIVVKTVRESTLSKKVFVYEHLAHETIKKPEMAKDAPKMSEADINSAVDTLVEEVSVEGGDKAETAA